MNDMKKQRILNNLRKANAEVMKLNKLWANVFQSLEKKAA